MAINRRSRLARRQAMRSRRQTGAGIEYGDWELSINVIPLLNEIVSIAAGVVIGTYIERRLSGVIDDPR